MITFRDKSRITAGELRNSRGLAFTFLQNGSIFAVTHDGILINQILGNPIDGGLGNIYIRRHGPDGLSDFPVLGPASQSQFQIADAGASWQGSERGIEYRCDLRLAPEESIWFWTLHLRNANPDSVLVDLVLAQDVGLGAPGAVRSNELYTSQYIDHAAYQSDQYGYVVCSRQNQPQDERFPWLLQGCFEGADGYLTDGFQFFGLEYKATNVPAALRSEAFPNATYQYEIALPTLKTRTFQVPAGGEVEVTFFAVYTADHPAATSPQDLNHIADAVRAFDRLSETVEAGTSATLVPTTPNLICDASLFAAQTLTSEDLDRYFGTERRHVEWQDGAVLSFFYGDDYHVVLKEKELVSERPHGHILRSGSRLAPDENVLSLTAWMYGVFNSHLAIGNTNFDKLLTVSRNPLNVLKSSGQRILVKMADRYELLGLPSAFEMGMNSARWIYKGVEATIVVTLWTSMRDPACFLETEVDGPDNLEFVISNNVVLGDVEFESSGTARIDRDAKRVELAPAPDEPMGQRFPEARFFIVPFERDAIDLVGGDELLFADGIRRDTPYVIFKTRPVERVGLVLTGNVLSGRDAAELANRFSGRARDYDEMLPESKAYWREVRNSGAFQRGGDDGDVAKLNDVVHWYAHDALLHFTTPYGLEQFSGAAWGTRDVCQGPVEFLLATRHYDVIRGVLQTVYAHQLHETGDWPQWFMFDRYWDVYAPDSHGDIVIWPMKALCDYVEATDDTAVLDEQVVFTSDETRATTAWTESLFDHTVRQVERMEGECIPGTALIGYGHGDWEDTLQPADPAVRQRWVSPWTVELMYQTLGRYATVCARAGRQEMSGHLTSLCARIREDFNRYLVKDGVVAGLVEFGPSGVEYLLHPDDSRTGVHYRLLPISRGMISGMFTPEQAQQHLALVEEHLLFPDGAHLMDRPMQYHGGVERMFKRAERAANFGREIGLQYVHAHIRYIEAMAKMGRADDAFRALMKIIPIGIQTVIPSAVPRQSNSYFSSSDAAFADRYGAFQHFDRVKRADIGFKGGWRIYSSGPGLVIAQLFLNLLGLREHFSDVVFDPVIPGSLDGVSFGYDYAGKTVRYLYHVTEDGFSPQRVAVNGVGLESSGYAENPYRRGGMLVPRDEFIRALNRDENVVEIYV